MTRNNTMMRRWRRSLDMWYLGWRYRIHVEPAEVRFLVEHLQPGQTAVDIGCHKGAYLYWMLRAVGSTGHVFAFEPQPELYERLTTTGELLRFDNATLVNAAVSRASGSVTLERVEKRPSIMARVQQSPETALADSFSVPAVALDDYFAEHSGRPIHFIKCDAEGHEFEVFSGATRILTEDRPVLLFECERRHHGDGQIEHVFSLLEDLGYEGRFFLGNRLEPLERLPGQNQTDASRDDYVNNFVFWPHGWHASRAVP